MLVGQRLASSFLKTVEHMFPISGGFRGGSKVSTEAPFLAKSKIDRYTKATEVG